MKDSLLCKSDYVEGQKKAAHRILIELFNIFNQYKEDLCIVGGWVPDLMYPKAGHIGSVDVDILINHLTLQDEGYQNMSKILVRNGYRKHKHKYFTFVKTVNIDNVDYDIDVDILAGKYGGTHSRFSQHIQGIKALKATGGNFAFDFLPQEIELESRRPDGAIDFATINVVAIVPYFIMKTAAMGRGKPKDAYDLYFLLKNYKGGINALVKDFQPYLDKAIVIEMKNKLVKKFKTEDQAGIRDVIDFLEPQDYEETQMLKRDVYERFQMFLNLI